jgi:mannose-1-phosphate guanylyltransferase/mannose-6-phosphate isomerase
MIAIYRNVDMLILIGQGGSVLKVDKKLVIKGAAEITNGEQVLTLTENQSTYIPPGTLHCLSNPGDIPLEIIEVQSGSYVGEDDIERFEDYYGRVS